MRRVAKGIYKRDSGKFVVPRYNPQTGGKTYSHPDVPPGGFRTLREAREFKRRMDGEARSRQDQRETCDSYARRWPEAHPRPEESTNVNHRRMLKAFCRDFQGVEMADVSRPLARLWVQGGPVPPKLEGRVKGWKDVKRENGRLVAVPHVGHYKVVRAMWNDAVEDQELTGVSRNPFAALKVETGNGRSEAIMLTDAELDQLVAAAEGRWGEYGRTVTGPMITVAAFTGMRPGELYAMRWDWCDFENDEIHVKKQVQTKTGRETLPGKKGKRTRTIAMLPMVRAALKTIPRLDGDDHVFYTQSDSPLTQRSHWYYWDPVRARFWKELPAPRREEIDPSFDWYEMRHAFGSYLARLGVSPYDIADQMGHVDGGALAMKTYIHTASEDARDRVQEAVRQATRASGQVREAG